MFWFPIAMISALLSATAAVMQKKILFNLSALQFSFLIAIANLIITIPFLFFIDLSVLSTYGIIFLLVKSILGVLAFLCVMNALKNLEISNALPLLALTPGLTAILAFLIIGEGLKYLEVTGLILIVLGTYILEAKNLYNSFHPFKVFLKSKYHHFIIYALFLFSISSIMDKVLLKQFKYTPLLLMSVQHIFYFIIFLIIVLIVKDVKIKETFKIDSKAVLWLALISIITIGYRYTQILAVSLAPVALVLAVKRTSVLYGTVIGGRIFKDKDLLKKSIAAIIIVIGTMLILRD